MMLRNFYFEGMKYSSRALQKLHTCLESVLAASRLCLGKLRHRQHPSALHHLQVSNSPLYNKTQLSSVRAAEAAGCWKRTHKPRSLLMLCDFPGFGCLYLFCSKLFVKSSGEGQMASQPPCRDAMGARGRTRPRCCRRTGSEGLRGSRGSTPGNAGVDPGLSSPKCWGSSWFQPPKMLWCALGLDPKMLQHILGSNPLKCCAAPWIQPSRMPPCAPDSTLERQCSDFWAQHHP